MTWRAQNSFAGGVISKKMYGRTDLDQYGSSLSQLVNFKVLPHGGIQNRSGLRFCDISKGEGRLIPFEYSQSESYCLEVTAGQIRFYFRGKLVYDAGNPVVVNTPYSLADLKDLDYVQTGNVMFVLHPNHYPRKLVRKDTTGKNWELVKMAFIDGPYDLINTDENLTLSSSGGWGSVEIISSKDLFVATDVNRLIRMFDDGSGGGEAKWTWGYIIVYVNARHVTIGVVEGPFPAGPTNKWKLGKYSETTGYPSTGTFYERRLCLSGVRDFPQDIDMSRTDFPEDFSVSEPLLPSDAVSISLYSDHIDEIQWLRQTRSGLTVGTSGGEWVVTGSGGKDDAITPASVLARQSVVTPSNITVKPRQLDNAILFVDKTAERIYELSFDWKEDSQVAADVTLLSEDLFIGKTIKCLETSLSGRMLWVVMSDGGLVGLTYMRDQGVVAWHEHETKGEFISIASVSEDEQEVVYCLVKRTVDGSDVYYVEYFEEDFNGHDIVEAFFVDSGITVRPIARTTVVTGLDHLEGEEIRALADGRTIPPMTVENGTVELPFDASIIHIGLAYDSYGATLPIEFSGDKIGSTLGRMKDIASIILLVTRSYGCEVGRDLENTDEVIFNEDIIFGVHPELFDGSKKVDTIGGQPSRSVEVAFIQKDPLPLTINSMITEFKLLEE